MSKARGVTPQIQEKNVNNGKLQLFVPSNITNLTSASLDEFKNGFPTEGLSVISNRWWGSSNVTENENAGINETTDIQKESNELKGHKVEVNDGNVDPQGMDLLLSIRRRAADDGRKALKLGVFRADGFHKLGVRQRKLIHQIFKSSFRDLE